MKEPKLDNVTRIHSRFTRKQLFREGFSDIEIDKLSEKKEIVVAGMENNEVYFTTLSIKKMESDIINTANKRANERNHYIKTIIDDGLSEEQSNALRHITQNSGGIACIEGMAGTGKTTMLNKTRETYENSGYEMYGCALAGKAAKGLEDGSKIPSSTIHSLLINLERNEKDEKRIELTRKSIVVVDEAGMVPSHLMASLSQHVHSAGAKMVLVGDDRQLQPIEAGGIFGKLKEDLGAARLTTIYRQKEEWMRDAVHNFADGKAKDGLYKYEENGKLTFNNKDDIKKDVVAAWNEGRKESSIENSIIISDLNKNVKELNDLAREKLFDDGYLISSNKLNGSPIDLAVNDRIVFGSNNKDLGVKNGELATVTSVDVENSSFTAVKDDGETVGINTMQYNAIAHGYALTVHKSQGVTVDNCYVLAGPMFDREMSYVAMSRHRNDCKLFADDSYDINKLSNQFSRSNKKNTSVDAIDSIEQSFDRVEDLYGEYEMDDNKKIELDNEEIKFDFNWYGVDGYASDAEKKYMEATEVRVIDGIAVQCNKLTGKPWGDGEDSYDAYLKSNTEENQDRLKKLFEDPIEEPIMESSVKKSIVPKSLSEFDFSDNDLFSIAEVVDDNKYAKGIVPSSINDHSDDAIFSEYKPTIKMK